MKRIGNLYSQIAEKGNIEQAFYEGIRNKRTHPAVRKLWKDDFPKDALWNEKLDPEKVNAFLEDVRYRILVAEYGDYEHDTPRHKHQFCTSKSKKQSQGKWRDIYCPSLRDHIMHHALLQVSLKYLERGMYRYCCGNVVGRGGEDARKAIERWLQTDMQMRYFVKLDIHKFFDSIRLEDMRDALRMIFKDEAILRLYDSILTSAPVVNPVGYYTSPALANVLLQPLDHYITESLYKLRRGEHKPFVSHYVRYMDDMLLFGTSKRDLEKAVRGIEEQLNLLGLKLKPSWEIKRIAEYENGKLKKGTYRIDYCGYRFDRTRTILRGGIYISTKRLAHRMKKKQQRDIVELHDCESLVSKTGYAANIDHNKFYREVESQFSLRTAKEVISDATKRGVSK